MLAVIRPCPVRLWGSGREVLADSLGCDFRTVPTVTATRIQTDLVSGAGSVTRKGVGSGSIKVPSITIVLGSLYRGPVGEPGVRTAIVATPLLGIPSLATAQTATSMCTWVSSMANPVAVPVTTATTSKAFRHRDTTWWPTG